MYQIWFKYLLLSLRSTNFCSRSSFDDVTRINFRLIFSHADTSMTRCFSLNLVQIFLTVIEILAFYEIQDGRCRHLRFFGGNCVTIHEGPFVVGSRVKFFCHDRPLIFFIFQAWQSYICAPPPKKIQLLGVWHQNLWEHRLDPKRHGTSLRGTARFELSLVHIAWRRKQKK